MNEVPLKNKYSLRDGSLDLELLRKEFPVLTRSIRGKRLVYLDSGASALKPERVIKSIERYLRMGTANIHRGVHLLSEEATGLYEESRAKIKTFINAPDDQQIVFTSGTTASINLVARCFVKPRLRQGDEILITALEHHANIVPWQMICEETGALLKVAPIDENGDLILEKFSGLISAKTKFISLSWVSNALGTVNPVEKIVKIANQNNIPVLVDAAQAVTHFPIDVTSLNVDFLAFSGHKLYGPTGVGVLYGKKQHLESMPPLFGGGDMIKTVTFEKSTYADPPARFEAGTPDIAAVIALAEAVDFVQSDLGFEVIKKHEDFLFAKTSEALSEIPGLKIIGNAKVKTPIFSFVLDGIHAHDVGSILDQHGVAVRTGHHCAQPLLAIFGLAATARASFSIFNGEDDIQALVHGIWRAKELFV